MNQSIHVSLHPDRLEIESPGGFMGGVTPANVMRHPAGPAEPPAGERLPDHRSGEPAGLGVDRLHEEALRAGKRPPRYEADSGYVRLILPTRTDPDFAAFVAGERETGSELGLDDLLVLEALTRGAELDRWTAADCLQIGEAAAADRLVSLRERGYLIPSGRGRGTRVPARGPPGAARSASGSGRRRGDAGANPGIAGGARRHHQHRCAAAHRRLARQGAAAPAATGRRRTAADDRESGGARYVAGPRLG